MKNAAIFAVLAILALAVLPQDSFGHGAGSETLAPQRMGDRTVAVDVTSGTDNATNAKQVTFSLFDTSTRDPIQDVSYHIKAIKDSKILFEGDYTAGNGVLRFEFIPTDSPQIKAEEKQGGGLFGALFGTNDSFVEVSGDIFHKGGLYKFEIYIMSAKNYSGKSDSPVRFDAGISFLESDEITVDTDSGMQQIKVLSYYDIPDNIGYSKKTTEVSFSMPFDWSDSGINQTSVVHQEVFIPKSFAEFLATKYDLRINKTPLPDSAVIIDDYTDSSFRIIHIVISNTVLQNIRQVGNDLHDMQFTLQPSKEDSFPITRYTSNAQYKVNLSWDPPTIISGSDVRLYFTIQDAYLITNKTLSASYDLKVMRGDSTLFKTSGTTDAQQNAKNMITVPIAGNSSGPVTIKFENVGGNNLATAEFFTSIKKPAVQAPTFPIRLASSLPDSKEGNYDIDLTWFPSAMSTNEQTEFVFTVKDKEGRPIPQSSFDFTILQKENEIFRQSASAPAGGTYIDYTFSKEQEGPVTLRIENINHSDESVELTVIVTPEFPLGTSMLVSAIGIVAVLVWSKIHRLQLVSRIRL